MSKKTKSRESALAEVQRLKANRRKDIIKCAAAIVVIVVLIYGKSWLEVNGLIPTGNVVIGAAMMAAGLGLAIFAGTASVDFAKSGHLIDEACARAKLSKEDVKAYEKGA